jgi:hypothetical protein
MVVGTWVGVKSALIVQIIIAAHGSIVFVKLAKFAPPNRMFLFDKLG